MNSATVFVGETILVESHLKYHLDNGVYSIYTILFNGQTDGIGSTPLKKTFTVSWR